MCRPTWALPRRRCRETWRSAQTWFAMVSTHTFTHRYVSPISYIHKFTRRYISTLHKFTNTHFYAQVRLHTYFWVLHIHSFTHDMLHFLYAGIFTHRFVYAQVRLHIHTPAYVLKYLDSKDSKKLTPGVIISRIRRTY